MQQTEQFKLNLVEAIDPFSAELLRDNTEKVEQALKGVTVRYGTYEGDGRDGREIEVGFYPKLVILMGKWYENYSIFLIARDVTVSFSASGMGETSYVVMTENGFRCVSGDTHNRSGTTQYWIAIP